MHLKHVLISEANQEEITELCITHAQFLDDLACIDVKTTPRIAY